MRIFVFYLAVVALAVTTAEEAEEEEKVWPECGSAAADKTSSTPQCDPCSPQVYTAYNNKETTEIYNKHKSSGVKNYQLQGWTRFTMGSGKVTEKCPLQQMCGSQFPVWLQGTHPTVEEGIQPGTMCAHYTNGNCCTYSEDVHIKNCGNYFVYRLTYNKPMSSSYYSAYCIEPKPEDIPNICEDTTFELFEDDTKRGELETGTGSGTEPIDTANDNKWFTFLAGQGTIKDTCPGINHCGFKYPMWIEGEYPTKEGEITHVMGHAATSASNICDITNTQPVYIVKCGDKFYHKLDKIVTYSGFCIDEDFGDLCESAFELAEEWRGTTVDKARDHCDTNGITDFNDWYRIGAYEKKMPDYCVAPNKCGADNGYFVSGGHPKVGDGIVGRYFYYSSASNCYASNVVGYILNCGDKDSDDFIYKWTKPSGCDKVFCAEQDPCSSTVYQKLNEEGRAGRTFSSSKINDATIEHGWYRFTEGEGIMSKSPILPGHSGVTYPGWFDGEYPLEEDDVRTGKACFSYNGNHCYQEREVTVKNCKSFFVYHLKTTASNYGYTYEQDVCAMEATEMDQEWRLQYNLDAVVGSDNTFVAGWYEVTIGNRQLAVEPTLYKHGRSGKYPGWMEGEHPAEEEGIVERTVYFTTTNTNNKGSSTKVYVRNCGSRFIYYLRPVSNNYYYTIAEDLCREGSYQEVDQDYRLYSNPSEANAHENNDNKFFVTYTDWYRFMNGNERLAESPKVANFWHGGFQYPYQFPEGSHASVGPEEISEDILLEHYRGESNPHYTGWTWKAKIANCGNYYLYRITPLSSSYTRSGLVVDDDVADVCKEGRYIVTEDTNRLVSSTNVNTGTSDAKLPLGWYRLSAGLGYMPNNKFVGTQCSILYHGHLRDNHPEGDEIQMNEVQFYSTNPASIASRRTIWVKKCEGFFLYRLRESPGTSYRYCEATDGCKNARELEQQWRVNSFQVTTAKYESSNFGDDGWVYFSEGLQRMPEAPPPKNVGGCVYNGYIDSHPQPAEGAVPRDMRFPGVDKVEPIQVENCGDKYVYFLSRSIANNYCYVADTDVCDKTVYSEVNDVRRLHYSHKYGTGFTRFDLDNKFTGWVRYTVGEGRMMEEAPALTGMCTTDYQGWINGAHPSQNEGTVKREVCWRYNGDDCAKSNDISIKNCGDYYVYGISSPPPNNQYGHCIEQSKTEVCEAATKLDDFRRGMLTPTTENVNDQLNVVEDGYYRFMSGLGRLTSFPVYSENCGGKYRVLIKSVLEKDDDEGDALMELQQFYTSGWYGAVMRNVGIQCDGYWIYQLFNINTKLLSYCVEEEVCDSNEIKMLHSGINMQWLKYKEGNEFQDLTTGWYQVMVGDKRMAHSSADLYDCGARYPGYVTTLPPSRTDGIVPGKVCYRTSDTSAPTASCQNIYMKTCSDKTLYYLSKSPSANYAMCLETDVCAEVEGIPLEDLWRLNGTPKEAAGYDKMVIGWYKVPIGDMRLAVNMEEANCGATYPGFMSLGRHPDVSEGTLNTQICYNTGGETGAGCKNAQVVNCGTHYLYHLRPASTNYGLCVASDTRSMCTHYEELGDTWRSIEYSGTNDKSDTSLPSDWYRFTTGLGRMANTCPSYLHGGGHYPSYAKDLEAIPSEEEGVVPFTVQWRYTGVNCNWITKKAYIRNCGDFPVYWLPKQTQGHTTYNVEAEVCSDDQYEVIDDEHRLAWKPTLNVQSDNDLTSGWYRFDVGLKKINTECTPMQYGGTYYPGWMDGGHPDVGDVVDRTVYFRVNANCHGASKPIKVKNCGSFYLYRLPTTANNYGYTAASEPCDVESKIFDEDDRSIFTRSTNYLNDNSLSEGWYQFTSGYGVMPKSPPESFSCRSKYPTWMEGDDPSQEEGVVTRAICSVNGAIPCQWTKEIKVRNCGNNKMLYYFFTSPPNSAARYCVDDDLKSVCDSATALNDEWRGSAKSGNGHADRFLTEGWYKFTKFGGKIANYPVMTNKCGSTYPIWMYGDHVEKGSCGIRTMYQTYSATNYKWRSGNLYECQCMNGDYIYYHVPNVAPLTSYEGVYCEEQDPCDNFERVTGDTRSPWYHTVVTHNDHAKEPRWVKLETGLGVMPTYVPETTSCGGSFPAWYRGELPTEVGGSTLGESCFVVGADPCSASYVREARVRMCPGGNFVYHWVPSYDYRFAYCVDEDVCDVASEEWGREENHRLRYTSISGYYSGTRKSDTALPANWFRITIGLQKLPDECVGYMSCGALYPGWLQGEHPEPEDRIVDRTICFSAASNCCAKTANAKVVACSRSGNKYYLYRLYKMGTNYGYCVDESSAEVCKMPANDIQHITDERHGTGFYYTNLFKPDYQKYPNPGWFKVTVHNKKFIHYPPTQNFCGAYYPGWVEDAPPGPNDGVVRSRACYRDSMGNEDCYQPMPLKMKNCNGEMRYLYAPPSVANRVMCVEQDICQAGNYRKFENEDWRMAYTLTGDATYKHDYRKLDTAPYRDWIRFTGVGYNKLATIQQEYLSCGTQFPTWMEGDHPTEDEGVQQRTLYMTHPSNYKWQSQTIYVKNCGDYMLYNVDFNWVASYKWALCVDGDVCDASVTELSDGHRLENSWGLISASGDNGLAKGWYKFTNGFEKMPEDCPIADSCGSRSPGYLSHPHPGIGAGIVERKVCFGDADQCCVASTDVLVKNCGAHFVYRFYPTSASQKYCVEENPDSMCSEDSYTALDDEWRGENVPYDTNNKHNDNTAISHGWYRFTTDLGRMPEYSMAYLSCGHYYPGYMSGGAHPTRAENIVNRQVCYSTSATNEGQSCQNIRVKNCGKYYVYELVPTHNYNYGYCVAQDQCTKATNLDQRWRLVVNPTVASQSKAADQTLRKGWYRFPIGHGTFPDYEPDKSYGGATYPSYMLGDLPTEKEGEVARTLAYGGTTAQTSIRVLNCGEHYIYWLPAAPAASYTYAVDTDVCLHARELSEDWRNQFYISETMDDLHTDYNMGKDWYQFTTGFKMMAERPPTERYSCGTRFPAYMNQPHPTVEDSVTPKELCYKRDEESDIYQACLEYEQIKVKNCGDFYAYLLNPTVEDGAYCVYNRKSSCEPKVVHAKFGDTATINCTLNSEKDFDSSEVIWTKLDAVTLPDSSLKNMALSDDRLVVNIEDITDINVGVYSMYIPSTETSELVELILYNAVEASQKYYVVEEGQDVQIDVTINVVPDPAPAKITWKKLPNKELSGVKYQLSDDHRSLTIKGVSGAEVGTYRCTVDFEIDGVEKTKYSDVIVQLPEEEED